MTKGLRTEIEHIIIKYPKDLNIMCRLPKIAVFEFFVSKLIGLDLAKGRITPKEIEEFNSKLADYRMTRYMKLLYFLCLADAKRGQGAPLPGRLLSVFDNFVAYQRGPVEEDIYLRRYDEGTFTLFTYDEERLKLKEGSISMLLSIVPKADQEAVNKALGELEKFYISKKNQTKSILEEREDTVLVDLSHNLSPEVWPAAFYYSKQNGKISEILLEDGMLQKETNAFFGKNEYKKGDKFKRRLSDWGIPRIM